MYITVRILNVNKKVKFFEIHELFSAFGPIESFLVVDDAILLKCSDQSLLLDHFPVANKRLQVERSNYTGQMDCITTGKHVVFSGIDATDLSDECSKYGKISEVRCDDVSGEIVVECDDEQSSSAIYRNMYGKFYNKKRIRCYCR